MTPCIEVTSQGTSAEKSVIYRSANLKKQMCLTKLAAAQI